MPVQTCEFREHPITVFHDSASSLPIATDVFWTIEDVILKLERTCVPTADNSSHIIHVKSNKGLAGDNARLNALMRAANVTSIPVLPLRTVRIVHYGKFYGPPENMNLLVRTLHDTYKPDVIVFFNVAQTLDNHVMSFHESKYTNLSCIRDNVNQCATWILWNGGMVNVDVIRPTYPAIEVKKTKNEFARCIFNVLQANNGGGNAQA